LSDDHEVVEASLEMSDLLSNATLELKRKAIGECRKIKGLPHQVMRG